MARAKKELVAAAPLSRTDDLMRIMRANGCTVETAVTAMRKWRYIDFVNPRARLPSIALEWFIGSRGFLAGRILQLRATFSKGKSSFMYLEYAMAQLMADAYCLHIETEGAAAPADYIASFGGDPNRLFTQESDSLEDCINRVDTFVCSIRGGFGGGVSEQGRAIKTKFTEAADREKVCPIVMGIDSLSSLGKESEADADIMDATETTQISFHSRQMRKFFRNRVARFRDADVLLMLASHETANIKTGTAKFGGGGGGGGDKSSIAQNAIGAAATYGIDVNSTPYWDKEKGRQVGDTISLYTFKNKISPRYRKIELPLVWDSGFDLVKTDMEFLLGNPRSPFAPKAAGDKPGAYRHSSGITCKALSDKSFHSDEEFLRAMYSNADFIASVREGLRIRGCGFDFEKRYTMSEIPDALPEGVAGDLDVALSPDEAAQEVAQFAEGADAG